MTTMIRDSIARLLRRRRRNNAPSLRMTRERALLICHVPRSTSSAIALVNFTLTALAGKVLQSVVSVRHFLIDYV